MGAKIRQNPEEPHLPSGTIKFKTSYVNKIIMLPKRKLRLFFSLQQRSVIIPLSDAGPEPKRKQEANCTV